MQFLLTCEMGLENTLIQELKYRLHAKNIHRPWGLSGRVIAELPDSKPLFTLRSAQNVIQLVTTFQAPEEPLQKALDFIEHNDLLGVFLADNFRASSRRYGHHDFNSHDAERHIGHKLVEKYGRPVKLVDPHCNFRVDFVGSSVFMGYQLTKEPLGKRLRGPFNHRAAIKPTLAYMMLQCADIRKGNLILDATCGGGTILLEAAELYGEQVKLMGNEIGKKYFEGLKENVKLLSQQPIELFNADARDLPETLGNRRPDRIISNLPYGMASGKQLNIKGFYDRFLVAADKVLAPDGRMVLLTGRPGALREVFLRLKLFTPVEEHVVESGGLYPHIFVLEKLRRV